MLGGAHLLLGLELLNGTPVVGFVEEVGHVLLGLVSLLQLVQQ